MKLLALLYGNLNNAERSPDATGSQSASIALGHHAAILGHELRAETADSFIRDTLFPMDSFCFRNQLALYCIQI